MEIITFANQKGGTGKTNVCYHIMHTLADSGKRVLLIDTDPQCDLTAFVDTRNYEYTVGIIFDKEEKEETIRLENNKKVITPTSIDNVDIIAGDRLLSVYEQNLFSFSTGGINILNDFIDNNRDFLDTNYDYIVIDTNPTIGVINQNCYIATDSLILVTDTSLNAIKKCEQIADLSSTIHKKVKETPLKLAVILTKVDKRTTIGKDAEKYLKSISKLKYIYVQQPISSSTRYQLAEIKKKPAYKSFTNHIFKKIVKNLKERNIL